MKNMMKRVMVLLSAMAMLWACALTAYATASDGGPAIVRDASSVIGRVTELSADADAYVSKDTSSQKKMSFKKGESVFVLGSGDGWYEIFYKGENLYIPENTISQEKVAEAEQQASEQSSALAVEQVAQAEEMDKGTEELLEEIKETKGSEEVTEDDLGEALDKEFKEYERQDAAVSEAFEREQQAKRNALIWKIVIGVLVVAIIALSVVIAVKNKKADEEEDQEDDK